MIIVSQDKKEVINFEKILSVKLFHDDEDKECLYEIYTTVNAPGDNYILLGTYATEERAKEVLQEIVKQKAMFALFRTAPTGGKEQTEMLEKFAQKKIILDTYEMPKE